MSEADPRESTGAVRATGVGAPPSPRPGDLSDQPLPELLRQLSEQTTRLVRDELELAKAEMAFKGKRLGIGAGAFGAAGVIAVFALGALTACLILALHLAVAGWLAALIVTVLYALVAGVAALIGKGKVGQATPPVPEQAIQSTKEDVEWTKSQARQTRS